MPETLQGLSESEARARHERGQGNNVDISTSRSYWQIVWHSLFTFVNVALILIGVALVVLGTPADAITTAGLVVINASVGIFQEARAKQQLDKIALLTRPTVTVIRDGARRALDPAEVVLGDLMAITAGDQLVCDGQILQETEVELDESLLTGESDFIPKNVGDTVYSGSYCVAGSAIYEATKVGAESTASKITAKARDFKVSLTPLQQDVKFIVWVVGVISVILLGLFALLRDLPAVEVVRIAAVTIGLIPQGLIFLVTLAYALGAVRIVRKGALVQRSNAVESMSNITVLCLDKTGTLTTNRIAFRELIPNNISEEEFRRCLGSFAASVDSHNRTSEAIHTALQGVAATAQEEVPFASAHKWSGINFASDGLNGSYILGAPEVIYPDLQAAAPQLAARLGELAEQGLRVVLFAHQTQAATLHDSQGKPQLPANLIPLGCVSLSDELRPDAYATLQNFAAANIKLKIISGDNPRTVAALARQAGFDTSGGVLSAIELNAMDEKQFAQAAAKGAVFGRITPDLKERLVEALQAEGEYVAMMGDGVNDVLSLKKANIGIAMQSGSTATRNVADIVLLNDSFAVLPEVFQEGQRIVNGILDTMRLLLSRTTSVALLICAALVAGVEFPFLPRQDVLNSLATAGLPPLILTVIARRGQPPKNLLYTVSRVIFPMGLLTAITGLGVYQYFLDGTDLDTARTALTLEVILCGLILIFFIKPPFEFLAITDPLTRDWRPAATAAGLLGIMALIMLITPVREFFALEALRLGDYALLVGVAFIWAIVLWGMLRLRLFEWLFGSLYQ